MKRLLLAVLVCSLVLFAVTGTASAKTPSLKSLAKSVNALQKQVKRLSGKLTTANATIASLQTKLTSDETTIADQGAKLSNAASLLAIAPYVSLDPNTVNGIKGPNIFFTGANLHVVDGSGYTDDNGGTLTGLGNLIVGYDEQGQDEFASPTTTTGSHNIVCGFDNSFSSYGGFVAGWSNSISGTCSSVTGGIWNAAIGNDSTVGGGESDVASGILSWVGGGQANTASGEFSAVSGGYSNKATGENASVTGGGRNTASGQDASISGGGGYSAGLIESNAYGWAAGINSGAPTVPIYEAH